MAKVLNTQRARKLKRGGQGTIERPKRAPLKMHLKTPQLKHFQDGKSSECARSSIQDDWRDKGVEDAGQGAVFPQTVTKSQVNPKVVIYHGSAGAFAHIACSKAFPDARTIAAKTLLEVVDAVRAGVADVSVLPCENVLAGRVPDIHLLLPKAGLSIVGEIFLPIELHLVAPEGWTLDQIKRVHSHPVALLQVQRFLKSNDYSPVEQTNTAVAASLIKKNRSREDAAVASELAAKTYGLKILKANIEDNPFNMTRFYVLAAAPKIPSANRSDTLTCLMFEVSNAPGALFRAVGGFAENGINLTRLESYLVGGQFVATQFLCEFEGHPAIPSVRHALATLSEHTTSNAIIGVFPMHSAGARTRADRDYPSNIHRSDQGCNAWRS